MSETKTRPDGRAIRIVRIIARLNVGGPAIQAITLTKRLEADGYRTTLVRGVEGPDEGNMDHLAVELGVQPERVRWMRRNPGWRDIPAVLSLIRILRRERPHIVHTHAAKGGTLGRVAALAASLRRNRPVLVHTYHGHSLIGYFSPPTAAVYRRVEQVLARFTDRLIAVSDEVRDELVAMGVAPQSKFEVVPLGFDLSPFAVGDSQRIRMREALRTELRIPMEAKVVTLVARLTPIKRVDRFLRIANALRDIPEVRFLIVGDGELRASLQASADASALGGRLVWSGFRRDMPAIYAASDVVMQTSDNEGTPVALIEAQATRVPVLSTRVGGAPSAVGDDWLLAAPDDESGLAERVRALLSDSGLASRLGTAGQHRVLARFDLQRLVLDVEALYRELQP